jgi:RimJ/RimL family protein N-acetyltransferase
MIGNVRAASAGAGSQSLEPFKTSISNWPSPQSPSTEDTSLKPTSVVTLAREGAAPCSSDASAGLRTGPSVASQTLRGTIGPRPRPSRVPLEGRWVNLEPLAAEHFSALQSRAIAAPESWAWMPFGPFEAEIFHTYLRFAAKSSGEIIWAVRPRDLDGTLGLAAGWVALLDIQPEHAALELGNIWFPPGLSRTRAATEALALLLEHVFDDLDYRRVAWKCDARHQASRNAADRLGFRSEGVARSHMIVRGQRRDTAWYSILDDEWPQRRDALAVWLDESNFDAAGRAHACLRRTP